MKKGIWILIPFIIVVIFAATYAFQKKSVVDTTEISPKPSNVVSPIPTQQTNLLYENAKYKFTLTFPLTWQGYKVTTYEDKNPQDRSICFSFENSSPNSLPICVLQLNIFTISEWNTIVKKPTLITQNNLYVFAWSYNNDCMQADTFQCARIKETPSIISTFSLK